MAASDSPPIGLDHPTVKRRSNAAASADAAPEYCECNDCEYVVEVGGDLPATCPHCGGALTLVTSE